MKLKDKLKNKKTSKPFVLFQAGDALALASHLASDSVDCIVTSPPYWSLRSYLPDTCELKPLEIGLEGSPTLYVEKLCLVFDELRRALHPKGTLWLNIGDTYAGGDPRRPAKSRRTDASVFRKGHHAPPDGLKPRDLVGLPWRVAFALRDRGWYLRSEIIWVKTRYKPGGVRNRPTYAHEQIFMFTKIPAHYTYNYDEVLLPLKNPEKKSHTRVMGQTSDYRGETSKGAAGKAISSSLDGKLLPTIWEFPTATYKGAHTAVFPEELPRRCIRLGCQKRGLVLDPFCGTGTTLAVAQELGFSSMGFDLDKRNEKLLRGRIEKGAVQ